MKRLSEKEIDELYKYYDTPEHVKLHCKEVTRVALKLAEALNDHGYSFDLELINSSGLAHDAARVLDRHWDVCADRLSELGFNAEAEIVRAHMFYQFENSAELSETDMICLGDRLVVEHDYVGIDARFEDIIQKGEKRGFPEVRHRMMISKEVMKKILQKIESVTGKTINEIVNS